VNRCRDVPNFIQEQRFLIGQLKAADLLRELQRISFCETQIERDIAQSVNTRRARLAASGAAPDFIQLPNSATPDILSADPENDVLPFGLHELNLQSAPRARQYLEAYTIPLETGFLISSVSVNNV